MAIDYDSAWKFAIEELLSPMLQLLYPELWEAVDWSVPPVFMDKELPRITGMEQMDQRFVDKLIRLQLKDESKFLLMLHLEVQDRAEKGFCYRMYVYYHILEGAYRDTYKVTSLAILSDLNASWRPSSHESGVFGTKLSFCFPVIKLLDLEPKLDELIATGNPFALVIAAHLKSARTKRKKQDRSHWKREYMRLALTYGRSRIETEAVLNFIDWVMVLPRELDTELREVLNSGKKEGDMTYFGGVFGPIRKQAHEDGKREGKIEGKAQALYQMLAAKFGDLPEQIRKRIDAAPMETIDRWLINIINRDKLEDVLS